MTVAVSCNLSDGVILGVDSAVSVPTADGISKVYENAEKLFPLEARPIGVAIYGLGSIGDRSIGSHLREFTVTDPNGVISGQTSVADVVEELRGFFQERYMSRLVPNIEAATGKKWQEIPEEERAHLVLGLVVGGFSSGAYQSEVWNILIPAHDQPGSANNQHPQGSFGTGWFAMFDPIRRYIKGYEGALIDALFEYVQTLLGRQLNPGEIQQVQALLEIAEYSIPFGAMPMEEGVAHTRFLVELVIGHHRFATGAPVVGGRPVIGRVSYGAEEFQILGR